MHSYSHILFPTAKQILRENDTHISLGDHGRKFEGTVGEYNLGGTSIVPVGIRCSLPRSVSIQLWVFRIVIIHFYYLSTD